MGPSDTVPPFDGTFPEQAYLNREFIESEAGRLLRLSAEFLEPQERFKREGIRHTLVFFGSARILPEKSARERLDALQQGRADENLEANERERQLEGARQGVEAARYYTAAEELAERLTRWALELPEEHRFHICTGGGPGIMEAANRGARRAGGRSVGLNIKIPTEQKPNPYISPELGFHFRYFFMRKFWFAYLSRGLICFPGGLGTMDEVFEFLTLMKAARMDDKRPVVFFGTDFWRDVIRFEAMFRYGTVDRRELEFVHYTDSVEDAFEHIVRALEENCLRPWREGVPEGTPPLVNGGF